MMNIVRTVIMAGAMVGLASLSMTIAEARQGASKQKSAKSADAPAEGRDAEATLDRARRALDAGKAETAQQLADAVLTSANKDTRNTARALAIRGEAYLSQGRPVEAVADLDSALWLKGGLAGRDRELATAARGRAMQTGGIAGAAAPAAVPPPLPPPQTISAAPRAVPSPARPAIERSADLPPARPIRQPPAWNSSVEAAPAPPPTRVTAPRREVAAVASAPRQPEIGTPNPAPSAWSASSRSAPPPAEPDPETQTSGGGGITGFFSSLFGGGQSASPSSSEAQTTSALRPEPAPRAPAVSSSAPQRHAAPEPRVSRTPPAPVRAAVVVAPPNPAPAPSSPPAQAGEGMYKLQLAAVRSKAEAEEMARKVQTEDAGLVGPRTVEVVEDVYGNMGRFYRVRIGPFPEPTQALSVCASLRDRRMDCMVLDR